MKKMFHYASASIAIDELKNKGFDIDFNIEEQQIIANPDNFEIVHLYRYEGFSNPDDESTVYGIQSKDQKLKGVFVAGQLANDESDAARVLLDLSIKDQQASNKDRQQGFNSK
ncbi:hypothetical protein [Flavobacterium sp. JP2137]|uniref:hypothetical protein n=1 Tax=Flavobacterium sp. JP2137 TaxID=3414510 RepID=UPI003D300CFE